MALKWKWLAGIVFLFIYTAALNAKDFELFQRTVQVHGFASQGFGFSNHNNYLTMNTSDGSAAMTVFGANVSTQLTDKLRVGIQVFDQNLGELGNWKPEVDWAMADYQFTGWFGLRGGKVKTVLGLYNDTQDMEFLHTWALMPQALYPMDVRGDTIAHVGCLREDPHQKVGQLQLHRLGWKAHERFRRRIPVWSVDFITRNSPGRKFSICHFLDQKHYLLWRSCIWSGLALG